MALDKDGFQRLYHALCRRAEVSLIFEEYVTLDIGGFRIAQVIIPGYRFVEEENVDTWNTKNMQSFLFLIQKQKVSIEECEAIVQTYEPVEANKSSSLLSVLGKY